MDENILDGRGKRSRCSYCRRIVHMLQLLLQSLMERKKADFTGRVVDVTSLGGEGGHACNVDDVAVVPGDHGRDELLHQQEGGDQVNAKQLLQLRLRYFENWRTVADASVVDKDAGVAVLGSDTSGHVGDC